MQLFVHFKCYPLFVSAVVDMVCTSTSECTDVLANTVCSSSQCACVSGYAGASCTGKTRIHDEGPQNVFNYWHF